MSKSYVQNIRVFEPRTSANLVSSEVIPIEPRSTSRRQGSITEAFSAKPSRSTLKP